MRYLLCFYLLFGHLALAQQDTVLLKEITIHASKEQRYLAGSTIATLDSVFVSHSQSSQLNDILATQFPIYFRNYGNGMISGISLRGTSPQHTAVLWNGININNYSLGQVDFSILPGVAFEEISLHEGGGSARFGSGALGGSVLLSSSTSERPTGLQVVQEVGSFGKYFTSLKGVINVSRFTFSSKAYHQKLENNFLIKETNSKQAHAAVLQRGLIQDIVYAISATQRLSASYWYHHADREIQPGIGQQIGTDEQQDNNHRANVSYENNEMAGRFSVNAGYVKDEIVFNGDRSRILRWIGKASREFNLGNNSSIQIGGEWNHITGLLRNYENGRAEEDRYDFVASARKAFKDRLKTSVSIRQPVVEGFRAPILPYIGMEYSLKGDKVKIFGNASKNFRAPTLNDRYWQQAGSTSLLPERSYAAELAYQLAYSVLTFRNSFFAQRIDDWIQWIPNENATYRPRNVKQVSIRGIQLKSTFRKKVGRASTSINVAYQWVRSVTTKAPAFEAYAIGKQYIYTPRHTGSVYGQASLKRYSVLVALQYSGKRYTEFSNSDLYVLNAYALVNLTFSRFWQIGPHKLNADLSAKNILNTSYQMYSGLAMPGRNFSIQVSYQINKSKQ
jgi:vitamin B12 transporter